MEVSHKSIGSSMKKACFDIIFVQTFFNFNNYIIYLNLLSYPFNLNLYSNIKLTEEKYININLEIFRSYAMRFLIRKRLTTFLRVEI